MWPTGGRLIGYRECPSGFVNENSREATRLAGSEEKFNVDHRTGLALIFSR
jgi:hypothetical protein